MKKAADQAGLRELIDKRGLNDSCGEKWGTSCQVGKDSALQ